MRPAWTFCPRDSLVLESKISTPEISSEERMQAMFTDVPQATAMKGLKVLCLVKRTFVREYKTCDVNKIPTNY